ncbi:MAG: hypothetical protein H6Q42_1474 [Deltaproteobacteria bacterium]|nr:hypothetical protein [Deltaproteobacteria bacterium]
MRLPCRFAPGNDCFSMSFTIIGRSDRRLRCPGKRAGAEAKEGREKPSQFFFFYFRKEKRKQRDTRIETAEARIGQRGTTAFFSEANALLPGHGNDKHFLSFHV